MKNKKIPARATNTDRGRQNEIGGIQMPLSKFIKRAAKSQYFRALIVRAIEDAIILFCIGVGIAAILALASAALRMLGVG